jgi:hypothetical protein
MKKICVAFLFVTMVLFVCCKKNADVAETETEFSFTLADPERLSLWCGGTPYTFEAILEGTYSIESFNESVASVAVNGKQFTVRAYSPGETKIRIADNYGRETIITCHSCDFDDSYWKESKNYEFLNSLNVVVQDWSVADAILAELTPMAYQREYQYYFDDHGHMRIIIPNEGQIEGSYNWHIETRVLTLNYRKNTYAYNDDRTDFIYEDVSERFYCDIQPESPNSPFLLGLKQDLTAEYAARFPNAGVEDVYILRHIISLNRGWITGK